MPRIIEYDDPFDRGVPVRPAYYDSAGYYGSRSGGRAAFAIVAALLVLLVWYVLPARTADFRPAAAPMEWPIARDTTNIRYVTADELNLRESPGDRSVVSYILPRGTEVTLLGEVHGDLNGNVWIRVSVETPEGRQFGWVRERYVS